jgi:hypothetical protein
MVLGTAQNISTHTAQIQKSLKELSLLNHKTNSDVVTFWITGLVKKIYLKIRLRKEINALLLALSSSFKCIEVDVFLEAGQVLQTVGLPKGAKYCYNRTIEELRDCNHQDVRLLALMGILECVVEISRAELRHGKADPNGGEAVAKIWEGAILSDLYAGSKEVQDQVKARLSVVWHKIYQNSITSSVNGASWMFGDTRS